MKSTETAKKEEGRNEDRGLAWGPRAIPGPAPAPIADFQRFGTIVPSLLHQDLFKTSSPICIRIYFLGFNNRV